MASTKISFTPSGAGNLNKWTISLWLKRAKVGVEQVISSCYENSNYQTQIKFESDDQLYFNDENNGNTNGRIVSNAKYRDTHSWYHMVFIWDKDNSTSGDKIRMYVNGERITSFSDTGNAPSTSSTWNVNGQAMQFGAKVTSDYFEGIMSHIHFCDGYAYEPTEFGETDSTTGEWKIKTSPSVSYGTNGYFWLKDDVATTDHSPNSNTFTASGTLTKTEDCPSNVFATNNSLWKQESSRYLTHTKGNTMISGGGSSTWYQTPATLAFNSGKFYWECKFNAGTNLDKNTAGVIDYEKTQESGQFQDKTGSVFYKNEDGGETRIDGSTSTADYGTLAQNDILGVAVDMDAATPTVKFYKNGSLLVTANASSLSGKFVTPAQSVYTSGEYQVNYGNGYFGDSAVSSAGTNASGIGIFEHDVPANYTALSTKGLNE